MSNATPTRRVLSDLNVNTFGTPSAASGMDTGIPSLKRGINDVEDPEPSPAPVRVRSKVHQTQKSSRILDSTKTNTHENPSNSSTSTMPLVVADQEGEMNEGDSQQSNKDSTASFADSDIEDDTMVSQQTAATEMTIPVESAASSRAENLRLRLRVALYKVQTNQTSIPMSRLQITASRSPISTSPRPVFPPALSSVSRPSEPKPAHLQLLPAPILRPTAYSTRMAAQPQVSSSPPDSTNSSPESTVRNEVFRTPALPRCKMYDPAQMSSPPDSEGGHVVRGVREDGSLTSSAVRGKAATGLLGLRSAGQ